MNDIRRVLSYNDVLLVPRSSAKNHLSDANLIYEYDNIPCPFSNIPLINAPMDKVCSVDLISHLYGMNMPVTIHRWFKSADEQLDFFKSCNVCYSGCGSVFMSVGSVQKWQDWIQTLVRNWGRPSEYSILVDMANGDSSTCVETVAYIRRQLPECNIMAGNISTRSGYARLEEAGANFIRAGIGAGSICTTRTSTGFGLPTLTSIFDCAKVKSDHSYLIADGGIEYPGDISKAMAAGADMVMVGKLLASTSLSSGEKLDRNGKILLPEQYDKKAKWVRYTGMASKEAQTKLNSKKTHISVEGTSNSLVPYTGDTKEVVEGIFGNLRSAMAYYGGCGSWKEFQRKVKFVELTNQGWGESLSRVNNNDFEVE